MTPPNETAVVISGGGAYGAFAVGVLKALYAGRSPATQYRPLEAEIITGTSVGAFNAALLIGLPEETGNEAVERLEHIWLNRVANRPGGCGNGVFRIRGNVFDYANPACYTSPARVLKQIAGDSVRFGSYFLTRAANFVADDAPLVTRTVDLVNISSFVDTDRFYDLLGDVIRPELIAASPKHLRVVATNWITGRSEYFGNSAFTTDMGILALRASTALPAIFQPVQIGRDIYVDGGVSENTPLSPAIGLGAMELHVIYLDPEPSLIPRPAEPNTLDSMMRTYYMMIATKISEDIASARWINEGIQAMRRLQGGTGTADDAKKFIRVASKFLETESKQLRMLTIHRYFPSRSMGGELGFLDFSLELIVQLIREGEHSGMNHDCAASGCVGVGSA